jgi:ABC-type cobalamin/Fe3+-siderophores transport system ATPase subunit
MKIKSLRMQRFRQFEDTSLEFGDFNLLVGPNNSGKTTVLHGLRAFFLLMQGHLRFEGNPVKATYHRRYLNGTEEVAPTPDIRELWHKQQAGKPITLTVTFEDDQTFEMSLKQQFGQIHVSSDNLPKGLTRTKADKYFGTSVAFIPGLVGVLVTEPYATRARRNALATQGRYSEIFRSSLKQLKEKDESLIGKINEWIRDLFEVEVSSVAFDETADEYVTVKYKQSNIEYDVVCSGAGLQQIIQMLTYLYLGKPRVLLIDEPDAHLHSRLQAKLGELFRRVAADLNAQVFLSTHSVDLIDTFSATDVLVVDANKRKIHAIGQDTDLVSTLVDANIIDVSALSRLLSAKKLVVIEDEDQTVLKAIDKAIGSPLFSIKSSAYVMPAKGVGNFRAIAELGNVLRNLTKTSFELAFLQDRDGMPDFTYRSFVESQSTNGVCPVVLGRHEIESYLIEPQLFSQAAQHTNENLSIADATDAILSAAQELKADARRCSRETAKLVNKNLPSSIKLKDDLVEINADRWFDNQDLGNLATVQAIFPGKELLKLALGKVNQTRVKHLTRGQIIASINETLIDSTLSEQLKTLAALAGKSSVGRTTAQARLAHPKAARPKKRRTNPGRRTSG